MEMGDPMNVQPASTQGAIHLTRGIGRLGTLLAAPALLAAPVAAAGTGTYRNPLEPVVPGDGIVESCADPTVIQGQEFEGLWYMYCTTDPLNDEDRLPGGGFNFRLIPM